MNQLCITGKFLTFFFFFWWRREIANTEKFLCLQQNPGLLSEQFSYKCCQVRACNHFVATFIFWKALCVTAPASGKQPDTGFWIKPVLLSDAGERLRIWFQTSIYTNITFHDPLLAFYSHVFSENEWAFDLLYCVAFVVMDKQWLDRNATYMEFNVRKQRFLF
jgi:hypothetical protein